MGTFKEYRFGHEDFSYQHLLDKPNLTTPKYIKT